MRDAHEPALHSNGSRSLLRRRVEAARPTRRCAMDRDARIGEWRL